MPRPIRFLLLLVAFILAASCSQPSAQPRTDLNAEDVAYITRRFLESHFSQTPFDDSHSQEMLRLYLNVYDPGHYYFLAGDIQEFQRYAATLDDYIRRYNIDIAFTIYNRFTQRMQERRAYLTRTLKNGFDLTKDETFFVVRKDAPYPKDTPEAENLFRKKLKMELLDLTLRGQEEEEAKENLRKRYRSLFFRFERFTQNDVVTAFLNSFTASYDPHSTYMSPDELENFNISMRLSLEGIGATLRWEDGYTVISSIIPGGAAAREGTLMPEDKIVAVGEGNSGTWEDATNQRLIDVVKLIRGRRGTTVRLAFMRMEKGLVEKRMEIAIVRDKIVLTDGEAIGSIETFTPPGSQHPLKMGLIKLPSFYVDFAGRNSNPKNYKSASRDVRRLLIGFKKEGVEGVVLDLRNNGGGGLDEAVSVAGLFLNRGPVVMVKDVGGGINAYGNPHRQPYFQGPLVVLVNRYSASASEIVAGALQDYGRAVLVGDKATFGKGTVQNINTLPRGLGALKTTVAKFYRPGSASTQNRGVEPSIVLPSLNNHLEIGESSLKNALPWDTVRRRTFQPWGDLHAVLPMLQERSRQRIDASEYFARIRKEVDEYNQSRKDRKEVSLNQLISERKESERRAEETKKPHIAPPAEKKINPSEDPVMTEGMGVLSDMINVLGGKGIHRVAGGNG